MTKDYQKALQGIIKEIQMTNVLAVNKLATKVQDRQYAQIICLTIFFFFFFLPDGYRFH